MNCGLFFCFFLWRVVVKVVVIANYGLDFVF